MIPKCKVGDCTQCGAENTNCVKVAKDLICLSCNKKNKYKKQVATAKAKNTNSSELDKWFEYVATIIASNPYCWECGEQIPSFYYRHASAHIFPKSIFESVSTHPFNFLVLGASCGCHGKFDSSIDNAKSMKVWDKAVSRFLVFEAQIKESHKYLDLFKNNLEI